ncbi:hypothetical protein MKW98_018478, partial [Papaver atlanticum]
MQKKNLPSTSTCNNDILFEHVIHKHVHAEIERLICRVSAVAMNTTEGYMKLGYMKLGPENR